MNVSRAPALFRALHEAIRRGLLRSCHDLSEGGLAVSLAEMAMAGGLGVEAALDRVPRDEDAADDFTLLFSESPTRFLLEVGPENRQAVEEQLNEFGLGMIGVVAPSDRVTIRGVAGSIVVDAVLEDLRKHWQDPLAWS